MNNQENGKQIQQRNYYKSKAKYYSSCKTHYSNVQECNLSLTSPWKGAKQTSKQKGTLITIEKIEYFWLQISGMLGKELISSDNLGNL